MIAPLTFGALSIAFAILLILELGMPYTGLFRGSPAALEQTIQYIDKFAGPWPGGERLAPRPIRSAARGRSDAGVDPAVTESILSTRVRIVSVSSVFCPDQGFDALGERGVLLQHFDQHSGCSRICA